MPKRHSITEISLYISTALFFLSIYIIFFTTTPHLSITANRESHIHEDIIQTIQYNIKQTENQINELLFSKTFRDEFSTTDNIKTITSLPITLNIPLVKLTFEKKLKPISKDLADNTLRYQLKKKELHFEIPYNDRGQYLGDLMFVFNANSWFSNLASKNDLIDKNLFTSDLGNIFVLEKEYTADTKLLQKIENKITAKNHGSLGTYHLKKINKNIQFTFLPEINSYLISIFTSTRFGLTGLAKILLVYCILQIIFLFFILFHHPKQPYLGKEQSPIKQIPKHEKIQPATLETLDEGNETDDNNIYDFAPPKMISMLSSKKNKEINDQTSLNQIDSNQPTFNSTNTINLKNQEESDAFDSYNELEELKQSVNQIPSYLHHHKPANLGEIDKLLIDLEEEPKNSLLLLGRQIRDFSNTNQEFFTQHSSYPVPRDDAYLQTENPNTNVKQKTILENLCETFPQILNLKVALLQKIERKIYSPTDFIGFSKTTIKRLTISTTDTFLTQYIAKGKQILIKDRVDKAKWITNKIAKTDLSHIKSIIFSPIIETKNHYAIICLAQTQA